MKNLFSIFIFCLFMGLKLQASKISNPDTFNVCLEISGRLIGNHKKLNNSYKVELIHSNCVIKSLTLKDKSSFKFKLNRNTHYAIRISKKGFVTRLISIYTHLPKESNEMHRFQFDTDLISLEKARMLDSDALDFPIAVISFDSEINSFYYNEEYTASIKRQLYTGKYF